MLTLVKFGGSLITDKNQESTFFPEVVDRLGQEIREGLKLNPQPLIIGHGSGSFGHFAAKKHDTANGVYSQKEWHGFAEVALQASNLSYLVANRLFQQKLPVFRVQVSAATESIDCRIMMMFFNSLYNSLDRNLIPLVHGDVCFDAVMGGCILSTEAIFFHLAEEMPVERIILLGDVDGVYDETGQVIPEITPANFSLLKQVLGGSAGTDVTGGMYTKVKTMLEIVEENSDIQIQILNGNTEGILRDALSGKKVIGTTLLAD